MQSCLAAKLNILHVSIMWSDTVLYERHGNVPTGSMQWYYYSQEYLQQQYSDYKYIKTGAYGGFCDSLHVKVHTK